MNNMDNVYNVKLYFLELNIREEIEYRLDQNLFDDAIHYTKLLKWYLKWWRK